MKDRQLFIMTAGFILPDVYKRQANIPVNMKVCEEMGLDRDTYSVTIPLGATINMDGAAITITVMTDVYKRQALTHAIEGYTTKAAWEMTDMFHLKAIELISKSLRGAVENTKEGREGMALGQYIAGMGFSNVGLGIAHSMAHTLGAVYDTPHGVALSLIHISSGVAPSVGKIKKQNLF